MRRVLFFLFLIALIGGGIWYFWLRPRQAGAPAGGESMLGSFFPVASDISGGNGAASETPRGGAPASQDAPPAPEQPFIRISSQPVAGYIALTRSSTVTVEPAEPGGKTVKETLVERVVRYVSRANGYVHEVLPGSVPIQISNIFIPNIYEALFTPDGKTAVLRYLRDDGQTVATYGVPVPDPNPDGTRTQRQGTNFAEDIRSLSLSPDGKSLSQLVAAGNDGVLFSTNLAAEARKELLRHPFSEWLVSWPQQNTLYLQTKASAEAEGFLYKVDTTEKKLRRVLGNIPGLTASVSPSGTYALYSQTTPNRFSTTLLNLRTNEARTLEEAILPEKCAWLKNDDLICAGGVAPQATYPDAWYQGLVSFTDRFYRIYTAAGIVDQIDSSAAHDPFDATNLSADESAGTLYFINKKDGVLWRFEY